MATSFFSAYLNVLRDEDEKEVAIGIVGVILIFYSYKILPFYEYITMISVLIGGGFGCASSASRKVKDLKKRKGVLELKLKESNEVELLNELNKIDLPQGSRYERVMSYIAYMVWGITMYAVPVVVTAIVLNLIIISIEPLRQMNIETKGNVPIVEEQVIFSSSLNSITDEGAAGMEILSFEELTKLSVERIPNLSE